MTGLETALGAPPQAGDVLLLQPLPHEWAGLSPAQAVAAGKYRLRAGLLRASPAAATAAAHVPAKLQRAPPPGAVAAVAVAPVPVALQHPVSAAQPQTSISDSGGWSEGVMGRGGGDVGACGSGAQGTTAAAMGAVAPPPGAGGSNADGSRGPHRPGGWGPLTRPPLPPPHATRPPPSMHIKEEPGRGDGRRCNPAADSDAPSPRTAAPGLGRSANPQHPPASSRPAACIIHLHGWVSEGATPHLSPAPLPDELQLCGLTFHPTLVPAVRAAMQRWADALTCPLSSADPAKQQMRFLGIDPPPSSSASTPSAGAAAGGPGAGPGKMWPPWRYAFQKAGVSRNLVASRLALLLGLSGESGCADAPLPAAAPAWTVRTRAVHPGGRGEVAGGGQEGEGGDGGGGPSLAACGGGGVFAAEPIRKSAVLGLLGGYVLPAADRTACLGYQVGRAAGLSAGLGWAEGGATEVLRTVCPWALDVSNCSGLPQSLCHGFNLGRHQSPGPSSCSSSSLPSPAPPTPRSAWRSGCGPPAAANCPRERWHTPGPSWRTRSPSRTTCSRSCRPTRPPRPRSWTAAGTAATCRRSSEVRERGAGWGGCKMSGLSHRRSVRFTRITPRRPALLVSHISIIRPAGNSPGHPRRPAAACGAVHAGRLRLHERRRPQQPGGAHQRPPLPAARLRRARRHLGH